MNAPQHGATAAPTETLHRGVHRIRGWIFCCAVFACPLVYSFQFVSFLHPKEMLLFACLSLMGLCAILGRNTFDAAHAQPWARSLLYALPLLVFLGCMYPGAQVLEYAAAASLKVLLLIPLAVWAADIIADPVWFQRIWNAAIVSGVATALLALGQCAGTLECMFPAFPGYDQRMYSVFGNQDFLGAHIAIIIPMLLHRILERRRSAVMLATLYTALAILGLTLALSLSRSAWLAAAAGAALMFWRHREQVSLTRHFLPLAATAILVAAMNAPILWGRALTTFSVGDVGGRARLWFWDGALRMIADNPVFGVGLGNYQYWSPWYQALALHVPGGERHLHNTLHTDHAHNEYLEFIAETGLIGAAVALIFLYFLMRCRGVSWIPLISLAVCAGFSAVLHSAPHILLAFVFCSALLASKSRLAPTPQKHWEKNALAALGLAMLLLIIASGVLYLSSHAQASAERAHLAKKADLLQTYEEKSDLIRLRNYAFLESWGIALLEAGRASDAYTTLSRAKQGLDTGRIHYLLGVAAQNAGSMQDARKHYNDALYRWPGDQQTFDALWNLAPPLERERLRAHADRFKLAIP